MTGREQPPTQRVARRAGLARAVRDVASEPSLRKLEVAYLAFACSEYATWLAVLVFASERGGAREVGIVTLAQVLPCTLLSPFAAYAGDRFSARSALAVGYSVQAAAMALVAAAMWNGAAIPAYIAAVVAAIAVSFCRPVMRSLIPTVTHSPADLVSANVLTGIVEQIGVFLGPALGGIVLALSQPATVFVLCSAAVACGAVLVLRLPPTDDVGPTIVEAGAVTRHAVQGFAEFRRVPILAALVMAGMLGALIRGASDLLFVVLPLDRFETSDGAAGALAAACGVGAIVGVAVGGHLVRLPRARYPLIVGAAAAALGFVVLSSSGSVLKAAALFIVVGAGAALLEFAASIAIQRRVDITVLGRVFGVVEGLQMASLGAGTVAMSALVERWSLERSLQVVAVVALLIGAVAVAALHRIGDQMPSADETIVQRLLVDRVFAPLPAPSIERLALQSAVIDVEPNQRVVQQGEMGDRYYLVMNGELDVSIDGAYVRTLGLGTSFGEIALLRDVPRTATVVARGAARLLTVARDPFLQSVTGHPRSIGTATEIADGWLGADRGLSTPPS